MSSSVCQQCGGVVREKTGGDRTFEYRRGLPLPVPDDFAIATCETCGETYMTAEEYRDLADRQKPAFLAWQKEHVARVLRTIRDANKTTLREIERACGVTGTYLSHLLAGRNEASQPLINLLEALALYPAEYRRQLAGTESWESAYEHALKTRGPGPGYLKNFRPDEDASV
jgi:transcriptional regulator with XRE-family HTH domain